MSVKEETASRASYTPVILGGFAALFWSLSAYFCCNLSHIPVLQLCATIQLIGALISFGIEKKALRLKSLINRIKKGWPFLFLFLTDQFCYLWAFRLTNPAHVDLINYLWPSIVIVIETICRKQSLSVKQILGIIVSVVALVVLVFDQILEYSFAFHDILGYILALCACFFWAFYSVLPRYVSKERYGEYSVSEDIFILGVFNVLGQSLVGNWVAFDAADAFLVLLLAVTAWGLAFVFWKRGLESPHYALVGGFGNAIPMLSVLWLIIGGISTFTLSLFIACCLVTFGCILLSNTNRSQNM